MLLLSSIDLHRFVQLTQYLTANGINIEFDHSQDVIGGVHIHTCSSTMVLSTSMDYDKLKVELNVLNFDMTFTMF